MLERSSKGQGQMDFHGQQKKIWNFLPQEKNMHQTHCNYKRMFERGDASRYSFQVKKSDGAAKIVCELLKKG